MEYAAAPRRKPRRISDTDSDYGPGVTAVEQAGESLGRILRTGRGGSDLLAGEVVVRRVLHVAEDADRRLVKVAGVGQPRQGERRGRVVSMSIVNKECVFADVRDISDREVARDVVADCLLYTSDAADDLTRVDLGGR